MNNLQKYNNKNKNNQPVKSKNFTDKNKEYRAERRQYKPNKPVYDIPSGIKREPTICKYFGKCGGCVFCDISYADSLTLKQKRVEGLMDGLCKVSPIVPAANPLHYRHKVHAVFGTRGNTVVAGTYKKNSHEIVDIHSCAIEDETCDGIIRTAKEMLKSFKIQPYDEDTGRGLLRHILVRKGKISGEIMVVLVTAGVVFPSKNNFAKALRQKHPEITTVVQNVNEKSTSMVLGERNITIYGKGYIEDGLCGKRFRISPDSFYQVNPEMTELLYKKAVDCAALSGKETVIDAYCGTGTIGIIAAEKAGRVIGVELNKDAVRDAVQNAKLNGVKNIRFYNADAGDFMVKMAQNGEKADVVIMDPPRSGSTERFLSSIVKLSPKRVVYVSCGPDSLARDVKYLAAHGYAPTECTPFDCFPYTEHTECVVKLTRATSRA